MPAPLSSVRPHLLRKRSGLIAVAAVALSALVVHSTVAGTGAGASALLVLAAVALALCGTPVWLMIAPERSVLGSLPFGLAIGLALAGFGVWLESLVGVYGVRWATPAAGALLWLSLLRRPALSRDLHRPAPSSRYGHPGVLWAVAAASGVMVVAAAAYASQAQGPGAMVYYVDLPWHIANTAEAAERVPAVHPTIPDVPLSFGWLYAGIYGWVSAATTIPAATIVTTTAPIASALLIPPLLATVAHLATRSPLAAALAPLLFVFSRGPILTTASTTDMTPLWISTNRDLANVLMLVALALVIKSSQSSSRARIATASLALFVTTFVACGVKGSSAPIALGAMGLVWLWSLVRRRGRVGSTIGLAVVAAAVLVQQYAVTKTSGNSVIAPLSFERLLPAELRPELAAGFVVMLLIGMIVAIGIGAYWSKALDESVAIIGASIAGMLGIAVFDHPGLSQLYFLHGAWPAYVVGFAGVLASAVARWGSRTLLAIPAAGLLFTFSASLSSTGSAKLWFGGLATAAVLSAACGTALVMSKTGWRAWPGPLVAGLCLACAGFQYWNVPRVETAPAVVSIDQASITDDQRRVLEVLRESSDPLDLVMTNRHCLTGSVSSGDCDPRWFAVAAFGERRVIVEGYGYSPFSTGSPVNDEYWNPRLLEENDGFLTSPSRAACERFVEMGVSWIYIDKRAPWSEGLTTYATRVADSVDSSLFRLERTCR